MKSYLAREIGVVLVRALRQSPVVVLSGLRQTGKSTLLQWEPSVATGRVYRTLDDLDTLELARLQPRSLLEADPRLSLDEIQRTPELFLPLKRNIDADRRPGRFVVTGSANLLLLKHVADSLVGRAVYANLRPFNRRELHAGLTEPPALTQFLSTGRWPKRLAPPQLTESEILRGGFPEVALNSNLDAALWFEGFERAYLERDVRDLCRVSDLVGFRRLLRLAALRVGGVLNVTGLARDAHLSEASARRYLDLLETLMVIHRLPPFLGNRSSRLIKSPKLYLADTGLSAFLTGVKDIRTSSAEPLRGALVENYVLQNLLAMLEPYLPGVQICYWHEQGQHEVDFVVEHGRQVVAIEVKAKGRIDAADWRGLEVFLGRTKNCQAGILAHFGEKILPLGDKLWAVPLHFLLA